MTLAFVGKVFDGHEILGLGTVVVEGGEISRISRGEDIPPGAQLFKGDFIMPGMIDAHLHFFGVEEDNVMAWNLVSEVDAAIRSTRDMEILLRSGFTAVRDLGSKVGTRLSRLQRRGEILGPTVVASGYSLAITGGDDDPKELPLEMAQKLSYSFYCDSPHECRKAVRLAVRQGASVIKAYASGAFSQGCKIQPGFNVEELRTIVEESHRFGLRVASHAYGREALLTSITAGVDTVEHGLGLDEDVAEMMRERGICYVPTLATYEVPFEVSEPQAGKVREEMVRRHFTDDMRIAVTHGLKIALGTDYVGSRKRPHGRNYREAVLLSKYMGGIDVLRASTSVASECIGLNAGHLREGGSADLIVLRGDPSINSEDLAPQNVLYVVKSGKLYRGYGTINS